MYHITHTHKTLHFYVVRNKIPVVSCSQASFYRSVYKQLARGLILQVIMPWAKRYVKQLAVLKPQVA